MPGAASTTHILPLTTNPALDQEVVSVVIPAFNAARTLDETLRSVRAQSWTALEIVVVDDGSTDDTAVIGHHHAERDARVRVIQQVNAGVAAARNVGINCTRGRYIAPIDADDLWSPLKIERQMQAVAAHSIEPGLVYTWFCLIDAKGYVIMPESRGVAVGDVLEELCHRNIVGTGSNALMLREAIQKVGGYDPSLRARGAQGSEDYDIYLKIGEHYEFAMVPEYLTGYRDMVGSMSSDVPQMILSRDLCLRGIEDRHPELKSAILKGRTRFLRFMVARLYRQKRTGAAIKLFGQLLFTNPAGAITTIAELARDRMRRRREKQTNFFCNKRFGIGDPDTTLIDDDCADNESLC